MGITGVGIDFGTFNTKISIVREESPFPILLPLENAGKKIKDKEGIISSILTKDGKIGKEAKIDWMKGKEAFTRFKLGIGKDKKEEEKCVMFLSQLYKILAQEIGEESLKKAKITVPNLWNSEKNEVIRNIFKDSGFKLSDSGLVLLPEPQASAIYYIYNVNRKINVKNRMLVVDAGAGTTDITLVEFIPESKKLESHKDFNDNIEIAGSHLDLAIAYELIGKKINYDDIEYRKFLSSLENAKIKYNNRIMKDYPNNLSEQTPEEFEFNEKQYFIDHKIIKKAGENYITQVKEKLKTIKVNLDKKNIDIDYLITAGGSGELFLIKEAIKDVFKKYPNNEEIRKTTEIRTTDDSIPLGAAIESSGMMSITNDNNNPFCIGVFCDYINSINSLTYKHNDVSYGSYGNYIAIEIVPKGSKLPTKKIRFSDFVYNNDKKFIMKYSGDKNNQFILLKTKNIEELLDGKNLYDKNIEKRYLFTIEKHEDWINKYIDYEIVMDENRIIHINVLIYETEILLGEPYASERKTFKQFS